MGGLLGVSPYATPFSTMTKLMGVWDEDINDKPAVKVGKALEERIIDYVIAKHSDLGNVFKAEEIYEARTGNHEDWESDFKDDVFAGHVDGIISNNGSDYILECKTARDTTAWLNGPPEHYMWQVALYNHFITKQTKAYFVLGVVGAEDYKNPNGWIPNSTNCFLFEVKIDREKTAEVIEKLRTLYYNTVEKGISVEATDNPIDVKVMTHLRDISGTTDELNNLIKEYGIVKIANRNYLELNKKNIDREDELKERIKDIMGTWNLTKAGPVSIRTTERRTFDFALADVDKFDYSKYLKTTVTKTLNYKE